ncbi:MAG TPA: site-2 protease family protein [Pseudonocardiaceae bacterium]|nr:site-2 protease family protein [Pseudonocardiaceae bacterium]
MKRLRRTAGPSPIFLGIVVVTIGGALLCTLNSSTAQTAGTVLLVLGGWTVTLCLHEFGHAYVALKAGDYSVRAKGYLTLDPRRYTYPLFSLLLPVLYLLIGGIPLPGGAVWLNHHAMRSRKMESLVSLAGPLSNLVIGVVLAEVAGALWSNGITGNMLALAGALSYLALLQVIAFIINILPIPGLDGWGAIEPWMSGDAKRFGQQVRPWAPLVLFAVLIGLPGVSAVLYDAADYLLGVFHGSVDLAQLGQYNFLFWRH